MRYLLKFMALLSFCFFFSSDFAIAEESVSDKNEGYSTNFRPGHNLSVMVSLQQTKWKLNAMADLPERRYSLILPGVVLRYAFHIALARKFGLILGTELGVISDSKQNKDFSPGIMFQFPSILFGGVYSFASDARLLFGGDYSAAWLPKMHALNAGRADSEFAAIPDLISMFLQVDSFLKNSFALSGVVGYRWIALNFLNHSRSDSLLYRLDPRASGLFAQTGVTWQLGDE